MGREIKGREIKKGTRVQLGNVPVAFCWTWEVETDSPRKEETALSGTGETKPRVMLISGRGDEDDGRPGGRSSVGDREDGAARRGEVYKRVVQKVSENESDARSSEAKKYENWIFVISRSPSRRRSPTFQKRLATDAFATTNHGRAYHGKPPCNLQTTTKGFPVPSCRNLQNPCKHQHTPRFL